MMACFWRFRRLAATANGQSLADLLLGPQNLRHLLVGRAILFWGAAFELNPSVCSPLTLHLPAGFMLLWWSSLTALPIGDATAIVYCWPILTAAWGITLLKEQVHPAFYACLLVDVAGLLLVARPTFLFER